MIPASEIAISAVKQLLTVMLPPRRLPKMELREHGIPDALRTVVAVVSTSDGAAEAVG